MSRIPRWRIAAAVAVLAALAFFVAIFTPVYIRNFRLQSYVTELPQQVAKQTAAGAPPSDDLVRTWVLERAQRLNLPVKPGDVQIHRSPDNGAVERIDVKYLVRVDFPGYTVNLHFYPGAGSK